MTVAFVELALFGFTNQDWLVVLTGLVTMLGTYFTTRMGKRHETEREAKTAQANHAIAQLNAGSKTEELLFSNLKDTLDRVNLQNDDIGKLQARMAYLEEVIALTDKQRANNEEALQRSAMINRLLKDQTMQLVSMLDITRADQSFLQAHLILMQQLSAITQADRKELRLKIAKMEQVMVVAETYIQGLHAEIDSLRERFNLPTSTLYGLPPQDRTVLFDQASSSIKGLDDFEQEWILAYDPVIWQSARETLIREQIDGMSAEREERTKRIMDDLAKAAAIQLKTNPPQPSTEEPTV